MKRRERRAINLYWLIFGGVAVVLVAYAVMSTLAWQNFSENSTVSARQLAAELATVAQKTDTAVVERTKVAERLDEKAQAVCTPPLLVAWQKNISSTITQKVTTCAENLRPHEVTLQAYTAVTTHYEAEQYFADKLRDAQSKTAQVDARSTTKHLEAWREARADIEAYDAPASINTTKQALLGVLDRLASDWRAAQASSSFDHLPATYDELANIQLDARAERVAVETLLAQRAADLAP